MSTAYSLPSEDFNYRIEVVATGNELLDGSICDRHTQSLAQALAEFGIQIERTQIVRDQDAAIAKALLDAGIQSKVVIVTGGLGPTEDDRTLEVAAKAFGSRLVEDAKAKKNVLTRLKRFNRKVINDGHRKMMLIPKGSKVLNNPEGAAPAVQWDIGDRTYFFLPGVPTEFRYVLQKHLLPWFQKRAGSEGEHRFVYKLLGVPESELNEWTRKQKIPAGVELGFRTHLPENHLKFFVRAKSRAEAQKKVKSLEKKLEKDYGSKVFARDDGSFEDSVLQRLKKQKRKVALAESCTAGLATSMLGSVSGASEVLERSFITYSNESKMELLGVSETTLKKYGAVSAEVAVEMALGALKNSWATVAVSITGIAGPTGGSKKKPVGLIYMARAQKGKSKPEVKELRLGFSRDLNQRMTAYLALDWLSS